MMIEAWAYTIGSVILVSLISLIGILIFYMKNYYKKALMFLVSFSAGALLGDAFIHLIPEMVEEIGFNAYLSLFILSGILIFFIFEKYLHWQHCHHNECDEHKHKHPKSLGYMNLFGDGLHNFIDGALIAGSYLVSVPLGIATTIAVVLHEIPQEVGDFGILLHAGFSKGRAILYNFITALAAIVGAILVLLIGTRFGNIEYFLVPFTAGGFIYIAAADLIPELHKDSTPIRSALSVLGISLGIAVMFALLLLE